MKAVLILVLSVLPYYTFTRNKRDFSNTTQIFVSGLIDFDTGILGKKQLNITNTLTQHFKFSPWTRFEQKLQHWSIIKLIGA